MQNKPKFSLCLCTRSLSRARFETEKNAKQSQNIAFPIQNRTMPPKQTQNVSESRCTSGLLRFHSAQSAGLSLFRILASGSLKNTLMFLQNKANSNSCVLRHLCKTNPNIRIFNRKTEFSKKQTQNRSAAEIPIPYRETNPI
jgi:hypothetical protein